jgi:hypothetical protein
MVFVVLRGHSYQNLSLTYNTSMQWLTASMNGEEGSAVWLHVSSRRFIDTFKVARVKLTASCICAGAPVLQCRTFHDLGRPVTVLVTLHLQLLTVCALAFFIFDTLQVRLVRQNILDIPLDATASVGIEIGE